ncbi:MAG: MurR/RpiR family transcriptional regulator [Variibacter sp.]
MRDFSAAIQKIKATYNSMSQTDRALAAYVIEHHREIAFASVARVGQAVKVSPATVVRFANHLGLSGYAELQALARRALRDEVDSVSKLQNISSQSTPQSLFHEALQADVHNLQRATSNIPDKLFARTVKALVEARTIYVVGLRSTFGLAHHLSHMFSEIGRRSRLLQPGIGDLPEQIMDISSEDVCIAISLWRYSRQTLAIFEATKQRGALTIALTDTAVSPPGSIADINLIVPVDSPAFFESKVAAFSVMSALVLGVAVETRESTLEALRRRELEWKKHNAHEPQQPHRRSRYDAAVEVFKSLGTTKKKESKPSPSRKSRNAR